MTEVKAWIAFNQCESFFNRDGIGSRSRSAPVSELWSTKSNEERCCYTRPCHEHQTRVLHDLCVDACSFAIGCSVSRANRPKQGPVGREV
jgi:hypothetical protein